MFISFHFSFFRQLNKQPRIKIHKHLIICYALYHIQGITYNWWIKQDQAEQVKLFDDTAYARNKIFNKFYIDWNDTHFVPVSQNYHYFEPILLYYYGKGPFPFPNNITQPEQNFKTTNKVHCYVTITQNQAISQPIINCTKSHTLITQYLEDHDPKTQKTIKNLNSFISDEHLLPFNSWKLKDDIFNSLHQTQICPAGDFFYKSDSLYFCRFLQIFYWYIGLACHAWMFNEAINLHYQLVAKVFGGTQSLIPYRKNLSNKIETI